MQRKSRLRYADEKVNGNDLLSDFIFLAAKFYGQIWACLLLENTRHICSNVKRSASGVQLNWLGLRTVIFKILSVVGGLEEMMNVLKPSKPNFKSIDDVLKSDSSDLTRKRGSKK